MVIGSGVVDGTVMLGTLVSAVLDSTTGCIATVVVAAAIGSDTDAVAVGAIATLDDTWGGFGDGLGEWGVGVWFSRASN